MTYSRESPSPRYRELVDLYRNYHEEKQDRYLGHSLRGHITTIKNLVSKTGARSILDYGSGKGLLYKQNEPGVPGGSIKSFWGVDEISCYDPGVAEYSTIPDRQFDGVISTDVLEHVPEGDAPWIVGEMFTHAGRFVYANIANYPALKTLANGENAHCTQKPASWWKPIFDAACRPGVIYQIEVQSRYRIPLLGKVLRRTATIVGG
jgi:hypothetical protein